MCRLIKMCKGWMDWCLIDGKNDEKQMDVLMDEWM